MPPAKKTTPDVKSERDPDTGLTAVEEGDPTPVRIKHPQAGRASGPVPKWAFDAYWSKKGWEIDKSDKPVKPRPVGDPAPAQKSGGGKTPDGDGDEG